MEMHSNMENTQEVSERVCQQPQPQHQRRIRLRDLMKQHRVSTYESDASVPQFGGPRYRANMKRVRELILEANEIGLVWGVTHRTSNDDGEFKLRLLQRANDVSTPQEQQQEQQQIKCVEMSRESLKVLCFHVRKIRSLMLGRDKALIFQNMDLQVYAMEEVNEEGFCVHFQDKKRTKVSLTYQRFLGFISALPLVNRDFMRYKKELRIKQNMLRAEETSMCV